MRAAQGLGETVGRAVAVAAQVGLLCPTGTDELMRRELGGSANGGRSRGGAGRNGAGR